MEKLAKFYMAYYDRIQDQIRFRWGTNNITVNNSSTGFNQFHDYDTDNGYGSNTQTYGKHVVWESSAANYSLIAGDENNATGDTGNKAGKYVALDVIAGNSVENDVVTIVWYDGKNLNYTYRYGIKDDTNASSAGVADKWSEPMTIFENAGINPAISVGKDGAVHIAAYDKVEGQLVYAHLPAYDSADTELKTCVVDGYNIVGSYISIDTAMKEGVSMPYISYYMPSTLMPKMAYLTELLTSESIEGVDEYDVFTGKWEVSIIPTSSEVNEDRINIGLWKNTNGEFSAPTYSGITASATTTAGVVLGNKTTNPILGYAITAGTTGYIETAQMK